MLRTARAWWVDAYLHVAYLWYDVVGCVVVLLVGFVVSRLSGPGAKAVV